MRGGDLNTPASQIRDNLDKLMLKWQDLCESWNDPVQQRFEAEHLAPLDPLVSNVVQGMGELAQVLDRARRECE